MDENHEIPLNLLQIYHVFNYMAHPTPGTYTLEAATKAAFIFLR